MQCILESMTNRFGDCSPFPFKQKLCLLDQKIAARGFRQDGSQVNKLAPIWISVKQRKDWKRWGARGENEIWKCHKLDANSERLNEPHCSMRQSMCTNSQATAPKKCMRSSNKLISIFIQWNKSCNPTPGLFFDRICSFHMYPQGQVYRCGSTYPMCTYPFCCPPLYIYIFFLSIFRDKDIFDHILPCLSIGPTGREDSLWWA